MGNGYRGSSSSAGGLGYGSFFSQGGTSTSYYHNGTGRIDSTLDAGGKHGFVYDSAGNTVFLYQKAIPPRMDDRASWYDAAGVLRAAEWRAAYQGSSEWAWTDRFEEYRYDALGRRVLVMSRWNCFFGADSVGYANCNQSRVRRIVWEGPRELWEIQMPARPQDGSLIENDTARVSYWAGTQQWDGTYADPNPLFGRVGYTYAGGVDQPVSVTRVNLVRRKTTTDTKYWNPVELQPLWNWRGDADIGTFHDGGMKTCTDPTHCVFVQWRGVAFGAGQAGELLWTQMDPHNQSPYGWFGTLIHKKEDATGTYYRRNRHVDPMTGRFTQEDPIGLAGGLNLYGFANGDPVSYSDPFGLCPPPPGEFDPLCAAGNLAAGFGDAITFGATRKIREWMDTNDQVDESSGLYVAGEVAGVATATALGASTAQAIRSGSTLATSSASRTVATEALGTRLGQTLFGKGGTLNTGQALRVGVGRAADGSRFVLRAAGELVERAAGRAKIDLIDLGKITDFLSRIR